VEYLSRKEIKKKKEVGSLERERRSDFRNKITETQKGFSVEEAKSILFFGNGNGRHRLKTKGF